ncbi:MAG: hypothetical protein UT63_C0116G0003 [Candidatus Gottesmanbacteria bacterium GW2011_GWC2_39_8]|uniref:Methyltransferase domain-containing protein n=1 Tax=Candidatus Gottesmanbacteria bacterium GW2011_GWC2_39_8 TaxID=1618450 RepID=A0A0G0SW09_9BACT|nr:MAG: hypothetical protein UT63_C0116G0003 [Candidatus Gottesmanbacteria bacterium GW2011_GWC2_39_8]
MENLIYLFILSILIPFAITGISAAPFVPTAKKDLERIINFSRIPKGGKLTLIELGCGTGRVLFEFARKFNNLNLIGIEMHPFLYFFTKIKAASLHLKSKVNIKFSNFYKSDLNSADIVYLYLLPRVMPKVRQKLEKDLKSGTKVISYAFPISGWDPKEISKEEKCLPIYLYERP